MSANRILGRVGSSRQCCQNVAPAPERMGTIAAAGLGFLAGVASTIIGIVAVLEWVVP